MNKYLVFTEDNSLIGKLEAVFSHRQVRVKPLDLFPEIEAGTKLAVIDGDSLPPSLSLHQLKHFKRKKIPVVYIFTALGGREVMEVLKLGVVSVLFKDYSAEWIKSELRDILFNFNYLEKVKEIAENNDRTQKFLGVVKTLTSDSDINKIMTDILEAMVEVFKLQSTVFFIAKKGKLQQKIKLGGMRKDYSGEKWLLNDKNLAWLQELQQDKLPIYFSGDSAGAGKSGFPAQTLLLPLVIKEKFFGVIAAVPPRGARRLTPSEIELLKAFAEQTSVALENAKLYWDVIKAREELIRQEKKALLSQTIISLNHEINNPLTIISMEAQMLQNRLEKNENKVEARIAKIEQNIDRIKDILEKISALNVEEHVPAEYMGGQKMLNLHEN
jgi:hypothetical protein